MTLWRSLAAAGLPSGSRVAEAQLSNGLRAIAAEVPGARQTRLALGVDAGYLDEPTAYPGLAHLLEHELFLGSRHGDEDLAGWVGEHGGRYNARTDDEATDYHLTLPPAATAEGLERLLALVASPRFERGATEREVDVIDAEFLARLADPALHRLAALSRLCRATHPARHCHAGNRATLGGDGATLCQTLEDFHRRHYRARRMALVLLAPLALTEQQALIESAASRLGAGGEPCTRDWRWHDVGSGSEPESESVPQGIRWVSPTGERSLELLWPLPPSATAVQRALVERIAQALMNGELAATLAAPGWLHDLSASARAGGAGDGLTLRLTLSEAGSDHVATILATCQGAVAALARRAQALPGSPTPPVVDLERWPLERARRLARQRSVQAHDDSAPGRPDPAALAAWLTPSHCRVLEAVAALAGESQPIPHTGTRYQPRAALPPDHIRPLASIPPPLLAPRRLAALDSSAPLRRLAEAGGLTLWHGGGVPGIEASLCLGWPCDSTGRRERLHAWRRQSLALRQTAASQGVILTLDTDAHGDWLIARGRAALLESVALRAIACWPRQSTRDEPRAAGLIAQRLLSRLEFSDDGAERHEYPPACWIAGLSGTDAKMLAARLEEGLADQADASAVPKPVAPAASAGIHRLAPQGDDHAVMLQVEARDATPSSRLYLRLLSQCHDAAFFQDMRRRRGLGYVAAVRYREAGGWPRLGYVVQSPSTDVAVLQQAIRDFLSSQGVELARLDDTTFECRREALRATCGIPETADEALHAQWLALRCGDDTTPWRAAQEALERLSPRGLAEHAEALVDGELRWRWWGHTATEEDAQV